MPIVPVVGRRAAQVRLTVGTIYLLLTAGAALMIIPFMLMLSASTSSFYLHEVSLVPSFLYDEDMLVLKHIEEKYAGWDQLESRYKELFHVLFLYLADPRKYPEPSFESTRRLSAPGAEDRVQDWYEFKAQLPWCYKTVCFYGPLTWYTETETLELYRQFLRKKYGSVEAVNDAYAESNEGFDLIMPPLVEAAGPSEYSPQTAKWRDWDTFRRSLPVRLQMVVLGNALYQSWLEARYVSIQRLNEVWGTDFADKYEIELSETMPTDPVQSADWRKFIRTKAPPELVEITGGEKEYRDYLRTSFATVEEFNNEYGTDYASLEHVPFFTRSPEYSGLRRFWRRFVRYHCPDYALTIKTGENIYRDWLREKYRDVETLNRTYNTSHESFEEIDPPCVLVDVFEVRENLKELRWYYVTRNYKLVIRYMLTRGRAFFNTFVLVLGTLLVQLTFNPFAAYALSRFRLPYTYKILVLLLGTMAFPATVSIVPNFLLIRELGLLNTFWALILPGAANGFFIFVLKSFFDGLPSELFETAQAEGASSFWMFRNVVVPLSKPVFAVVALNAFNASYGSFMWAFVVCQQERMWTLMVWLQQFANTAGVGVQTAALTLAGIPTLIVFIFCQRIIIRGIVIPQFK